MLRLSCSVLLLLLATATAGSVLQQGDGSSGDHKDCHKGKIRKRTVKTIKVGLLMAGGGSADLYADCESLYDL